MGGDLASKFGVESPRDIDGGQFGMFGFAIGGEFLAFPLEVGIFRIGLGTDGNIFPCGHGHRARDQAGHTGDEHTVAGGFGGGHTEDQAGRGNDAVVGAEDGGAEPPNAVSAMNFRVFQNVVAGRAAPSYVAARRRPNGSIN